MESDKKSEICPCNRCKSTKHLQKATVKNHIKLYGEFSYDIGMTVGEFIDTPLEKKLDDKFWTVARYLI
mgnify:CR=1 FL=1